jgi:hypothetical protein
MCRGTGYVEDSIGRKSMAFAHRQCISSGDVTHIEKVPLRIQIADPNKRRRQSCFDPRNLGGKGRDNESFGLPRTGMIEGAHAKDLKAPPRQRSHS